MYGHMAGYGLFDTLEGGCVGRYWESGGEQEDHKKSEQLLLEGAQALFQESSCTQT